MLRNIMSYADSAHWQTVACAFVQAFYPK